jgi:hypothetical protein
MKPLFLAFMFAVLFVPGASAKPEDDLDIASIVSGFKAGTSIPTPAMQDVEAPLYVPDDGWTVYTVPSPDEAAQVERKLQDGGAPNEGEVLQLAKGETIKILGKARGGTGKTDWQQWTQVQATRQGEYQNGKFVGAKGWIRLAGAPTPENIRATGLMQSAPEGSQIPGQVTPPDPKNLGPLRSAFLDKLKGFQGVPYVWGGTSHKGVDCSGLVVASLLETGSVQGVPRTAAEQQQAAVPLSGPDQLQPGDLIFERNSEKVHHVYVFYGTDPSNGRKIVEAMQTGTVVEIKDFRPGTLYGDLLSRLAKPD